MHTIDRSSWRPSAAYLYILKLDPTLLAWEYLRRNPRYRSDFCCKRSLPKGKSPGLWGLRHWEDPARDARAIDPPWQFGPGGEFVLVRELVVQDASTFDLWRIPGRKTLRDDGDRVILTRHIGNKSLQRARLARDLGVGEPLAVSITTGKGFIKRTRAAQDFIQALEPAVQVPHKACRPSVSTMTHMQILQALDGAAAGASHRAIARSVFGAFTDVGWGPDSGWRSRVRYLLKCGMARSSHGYRRMIGLGDQSVSLSPDRRRSPYSYGQASIELSIHPEHRRRLTAKATLSGVRV